MKCTKVRIDPRSCNGRLRDAAGHDLETGEEVALKLKGLEDHDDWYLENEIEIYQDLTFRWAWYPSNILAWRRRRIQGEGI